MRFQRSPFQRKSAFSWPRSKGRVTAARSAVRRDKENNALTPELVKFQSAEERMEALEVHRRKWNVEMRQMVCKTWRKARGLYFSIPQPTRAILLEYWNHQCGYPGDGGYLLGLVSECLAGKFDPAAKLQELEETRQRGLAYFSRVREVAA